MENEFKNLISICEDIFRRKNAEYGPVWAIFRWGSLVDQLWIKAKRIRRIEEKIGHIPEPIEDEYIALINYAIIFLMRIKNTEVFVEPDKLLEDISALDEYTEDQILAIYREMADLSYELCKAKNHDYGNAWRDMAVASITDLIIIKVLRLKHIIKHNPNISGHDVDQQLYDIINYSALALIKLGHPTG